MQGTMRAVPAIFLQYAKNKTNVELFKDGIITTTCVAIDILTIYKGVPAFTAAKGLRRAYIGFEVANATANLVLNLSGTELQGTQFANLVKYSDYIMLGIGVKDLVRVTGKSVFPALYAKAKDNVNQLNKQSIKYFLASYMRLRVEMTTLASVPANQSAKTVKIIYDTVEKELKATADGRAIFKEAEDLAKSGEDLGKALEKAFNHVPTSGVLVTNGTKQGTFLVGSFNSDLKFILKEINYPEVTDYNLLRPSAKPLYLTPNEQKFNMLNVSSDVVDYFSKKGGFFNMVNAKWIDAAVIQNADIIIVSKLADLYDVSGNLSGFGKEMHRLEWKHGYRFDTNTKMMLPPSRANGLPTHTLRNENKITD